MRNYLSLFWSNFKQKKRMFALEFCLIMVVNIAVLGVLLICLAFVQEATRVNGSFGIQQATFSGNMPKLSNDELEKYGIARLSRYNLSEMVFDNGNEMVSVKVRILENIDGIFGDIVIEGEIPKSGNEVLLPRNFRYSTKSIWEVGDRIKITSEAGKSQTVTISGFYEYSNTDNFFNTEVFKIANETDSFQYGDVIYQSRLSIKNKTKKIANTYDLSYIINEMQLSVFENSDKTGLVLYAILATVFITICYSMIRSVVALRTSQTDKENAIIRSLGIRKRWILKYEALEISIVSVIASAAATVVTAFLFYASMGLSGLTSDKVKEILNDNLWDSFAISLIIVWILSLASVLFQTKKSLHRSIAEILSNSQNLKVKGRKRRTRRIKNPVTAYIVTSLGRNKWKTILSIVLFSSSILIFVFVSMFNRDMRQINGAESNLVQSYDVRLNLATSYSQSISAEDILSHVKKLEGVKNARLYPIVMDRLYNVDNNFCRAESKNLYSTTDGIYDRILIVLYSDEELNNLQSAIKSGSINLQEGGCILVNYAYPFTNGSSIDYSKKNEISKFSTGDFIKIIDLFSVNNYALSLMQSGTYDEEPVYLWQKKLIEEERFLTIPIKGIADSDLYGQSLLNPVIILSEEYYKENLMDDFEWGSAIDVTLEENRKLSDIADNIKILGYFESMDYLDSSRTSMEASELIIGLLYVIIILAALIGFIIIMCTIMIEWEISQKEYAILKSIGATTRKVQYVILTEKAVICLASCISGVFFGIITERVLMKAAIKGNALPLNIPVAEISMAIAVMLGVTAVSTIIQSWSLKKMNLSGTNLYNFV